MPRIWIDYCNVMIRRGLITETRRVFDRSLRALPITQHMRIWPLYIDFVTKYNIPDTTIRVYRRFLKVYPAGREDFVEYLKQIDKLDEAAQQLALLVNEDKAVSEKGKTGHQVKLFFKFIFFKLLFSFGLNCVTLFQKTQTKFIHCEWSL